MKVEHKEANYVLLYVESSQICKQDENSPALSTLFHSFVFSGIRSSKKSWMPQLIFCDFREMRVSKSLEFSVAGTEELRELY